MFPHHALKVRDRVEPDATILKQGGLWCGSQERGWKIVGNFGDQFSDLSGDPLATISVKLPNPVYYIL